MRWVDRGPEPTGVDGYARQFTQGWIDHYRQRRGQPPSDTFWLEFRPILGRRTDNICWYCERKCYYEAQLGGQSPTVDHFRPRSRFPELTYEWSNWVFSCRRCNVEYKRDNWPDAGYVDPCANDVTERPDRFLDYNTETGEIIPKAELSETARLKAQVTINDLGLNQLDVRFYRFDWTRTFLADLSELSSSDQQALISHLADQPFEYAGVTSMLVEQLRRQGRL